MKTTLRAGLVPLFLIAVASSAIAQEKAASPSLGTIERLDPRFDKIVPRDARVERIAEGFDWSEGPVWLKGEDMLLFSDVPRNTVYRWREGKGVDVFLHPSGYTGGPSREGEPGSNGLTLDPDGHLVLMQHGDRRVARAGKNGQYVTLADRFEGKRFNSPNDGTFRSKGDFFFTDPPYGLVKNNADPAKEIPYNGVYRIGADGKVSLVTKEMTFPNGIALSPNETTLYVANSDPKKAIWMAFPLKDDGSVGPGRVFADVTRDVGSKPGLPDGMKVDRDGNLFATGPGGVLVFAPDGTHLGTFATGQATANCGWGEDGSTLFITADMYIGRVRLTTKGKGW